MGGEPRDGNVNFVFGNIGQYICGGQLSAPKICFKIFGRGDPGLPYQQRSGGLFSGKYWMR